MNAHARCLRCRPRLARGEGFTFLEILATLALLGVVLPAVMSGISLCLATADFARKQAQAASLSQGKLMELVAEGQWQNAALSGDFGTDWPEYHWTAQVVDWDGSQLQELDMTVSWRQRGKDCSVTLSTLVNTEALP